MRRSEIANYYAISIKRERAITCQYQSHQTPPVGDVARSQLSEHSITRESNRTVRLMIPLKNIQLSNYRAYNLRYVLRFTSIGTTPINPRDFRLMKHCLREMTTQSLFSNFLS
jgi:hypothetical protein